MSRIVSIPLGFALLPPPCQLPKAAPRLLYGNEWARDLLRVGLRAIAQAPNIPQTTGTDVCRRPFRRQPPPWRELLCSCAWREQRGTLQRIHVPTISLSPWVLSPWPGMTENRCPPRQTLSSPSPVPVPPRTLGLQSSHCRPVPNVGPVSRACLASPGG